MSTSNTTVSERDLTILALIAKSLDDRKASNLFNKPDLIRKPIMSNESQVEWLKTENLRLSKQVEANTKTIHRAEQETLAANKRASHYFRVLRELEAENTKLMGLLSSHTASAVGERGDACVAIDGGNL